MYKSFDLLKDLYFVRTSGSKEEENAANILQKECQKLGISAVIEEFPVDGYKIQEAKLSFKNPDLELECVGVGQSGNALITGKFVYVESDYDIEVKDIKDAVCFIDKKIVPNKLYKRLCEKGAAALILMSGDIYDKKEDTDNAPYMYRERHYSIKKIPAVSIKIQDAEQLIRLMPETAIVFIKQDEFKCQSRNVVATIEGSKYKDEIIAFTAHYDSVQFSKGAYDNATGSTGIMQLLSYFAINRPLRTMKFIWCGSEEVGLLGSKAYCEKHKDELENYRFDLNIDMIGVTLGFDFVSVTAGTDLVNFIDYYAKINGFGLVVKQGVYSSDSSPFADNNVPSITFARLAPAGGAVIHSKKDVMDNLSEGNYYKTLDFLANFIAKLDSSVCFPVKKEMPQNMKDELDYYFFRKERP